MYTILEQNGIDNTNIDGGAFNNFIAGNRNGILKGVLNECALTALGNTISIGAGVLMLQGIRIKITEPETLSVSGTPTEPIRYQIVAQVTVSDSGEIDFTIFAQSPSALTTDSIYKNGNGTYQVEIGRFTHDTDGSVTELDRSLDIISGGISGGAVVSIGEVTTEELNAGLSAEVDIDVGSKGELNFDFKFPQASVADGSIYADKIADGAVTTNKLSIEVQTSLAEITKIKDGTVAVGDSNKLGGVAANLYAKTADLAAVATSGNYNDLSNKPTINNATITFTQGGETKGSFATNQSANKTIALDGVDKLAPYPVGSVYISFQSTSPASLFGGTWEHINSRFLYSAASSSTNVSAATTTGGAATVTLTVKQIPSHKHNISIWEATREAQNAGLATANQLFNNRCVVSSDMNDSLVESTGGGKPHENLPPYVRVHMWRRTA